jgi:hypothetical protein
MTKILPAVAAGIAAGFISVTGAEAQLYNYDFGTGTGSYSTPSGSSTTFLPQPPTGGGNEYVRIGSTGGSWSLVNPGIPALGSGSELVGVAPTSASINKFAVADFTTATSQFSMSFSMQLSGGSSGTWYMFAGNGTSFNTVGAGFTGSESYMGLRWQFGTSGAITTNNRNAGAWNTTGLTGTPFAQSTVYEIEIYGNNTSGTLNYTRGTSQSTAANTYDLWVNGVLVGNDLAKAQLATGGTIDSFMFYGESSTGNVATITLDNFAYGTSISSIPEPGSAALLLGGLGTLFTMIRRKRIGH